MGPKSRHTQYVGLYFSRTSTLLLSTALFTAWGVSSAIAQVPGSVDPAKIEKRFDKEPQAPLPNSKLQPIPQPQNNNISKEIQEQLAKKRFILKSVVIEGSTVYTPEALQFAYNDMVGKEITLLDAQTITQRITDKYRHDDYVLSQAILPPQNIKNGVLKVRVVEGYINNVVFEGAIKDTGQHQLVQSYGENIKQQRPIKTSDLERYLLLIDDLPGTDAKGLVRPSATQFGAADLVVTLAHQTYEASYTIDNRGSEFIGPWQHTAIGVVNGALNDHDRTLLRIITTSPTTELRFIDLQHEEQIGSEGTRLILDVSRSHTEPGDSLKNTLIEGDSTFLQIKAVHPFIRSRQENLNGRVMFDTRDTDTDVFVNQNFSYDRLRVVRAGAGYDFADKLRGINLIDGQVSQGVNIFNASRSVDSVSNRNADGTFTKVNLDMARTQALISNFSLYTSASGQYAVDPLLAAEQFTLGGVGYGQAYDPAELSGDHGVAGKLELRYGQTLDDPYLNAYQLYSYYDVGRVWVRDGGPGANDKKSLASLGFGLRTNFSERFSGNFEVGVPLTKPANNQGDHENAPRFFVSATGRF